MTDTKEKLEVHVNVEITADALTAIVENAKLLAGKDSAGGYRIDTAARVGEMISRFLAKHDFENFVKDTNNFRG